METIYAGDVPLEAVLDELLTPSGVSALIGGRAAACFTLARRLLVPELFETLISNIDAIDRTTRQNVAFIVFHGEQSSFIREELVAGDRCRVRYGVSGLSVSSDEPHGRAASRVSGNDRLAFSTELTQQLRHGDARHSKAMARSTEFATSILMKHFDILESRLPCLVFTDGDTLHDPLKIPLSPDSTIQSLYSDVLVPVSDAFARLEHYWSQASAVSKLRFEFSRHRRTVETHAADLEEKRRAVEEARRRLEASRTTESYAHVPRLRLELMQQARFCEEFRSREGFEERVALIREHGADPTAAQISLEQLRRLEAVKKGIGRQARDPASRLEAEQASAAVNRARAKLAGILSKTYGRVRAALEASRVELRSSEAQSGGLGRELTAAQERLQGLDSKREAELAISDGLGTQVDAEEAKLEELCAALTSAGFDAAALRGEAGCSMSVLRTLDLSNRLGWRNGQAGGQMAKLKVLFLAANPLDTAAVDLEEELRAIKLELRGAKFRDEIDFTAQGALRPDDLVRHLREIGPDVVHFSGHGANGGIALRDDAGGTRFAPSASLARLFAGRGVRLLVLNACYTDLQATALSSVVGAIVGTTDAVQDEAAHRFSTAFYRTLADGHSIGDAFRDGGDAVDLHGLRDVYCLKGDASSRLLGQAGRDQMGGAFSGSP